MTDIQRVNIGKQHPAPYKTLITLSTHVEEAAVAAGLDPLLIELLRIRTSQINGCSFCLRMHTRDALRKGENPDRIAVLPAWAETGYFSETDRAALRLTEAVTRVPDGHVSDEDFDAAAAVLTADQISAVAWLATVMNALTASRSPVGTPSATDLDGWTDVRCGPSSGRRPLAGSRPERSTPAHAAAKKGKRRPRSVGRMSAFDSRWERTRRPWLAPSL